MAGAMRKMGEYLGLVEQADYDVFHSRVRVPTWRKALTAARIMVAGPDIRRSKSHVPQDAH